MISSSSAGWIKNLNRPQTVQMAQMVQGSLEFSQRPRVGHLNLEQDQDYLLMDRWMEEEKQIKQEEGQEEDRNS